MENAAALGEWLRQSRQIRGLTLTGIAESAGASNQSNLSKAERGLIIPEAETMERLAPFYGSPWLSDQDNILMMQAVCWVFTARIGFHPTTDAEFNAVRAAERAIAAAQSVVSEVPYDPATRLRISSLQFQGVPGLARMEWAATGPFWMWVWWEHAQNIKFGRERLADVEEDVDFDNEKMAQAFERLRRKQNTEESYMQRWPDEMAINYTLAAVADTLRDPDTAWYAYPRLDIADYWPAAEQETGDDTDVEESGQAKAQEEEQRSTRLAIEKAERIDRVIDRLRTTMNANPDLLDVVDQLLRSQPTVIAGLRAFLREINALPIPEDLPF